MDNMFYFGLNTMFLKRVMFFIGGFEQSTVNRVPTLCIIARSGIGMALITGQISHSTVYMYM